MTRENADTDTSAQRLVYFAAERTLMAWVRTALGLMALGFVTDRFGLVVRQTLPQAAPHLQSKAFSFWAGTLLVLVGALMALVASVRYWRFATGYHDRHRTATGHGILWGVLFTAAISVLGFVMAFFLLTVTD